MERKEFKELDKSLRKQKIVDTAADLFHKQGYRATTIDNIANQLGVTKGAVYNYVNCKEEILFIIYKNVLQRAFEDINRIRTTDLPPDEKLRMIIKNQINIIINNLSLMFVFFTEETQLPKEYYQIVRAKKKEYDQIIQKIIEEGISLGIFEEVDPQLLSYAINGICNWIYKWYHPKVPYSSDKIADEFIKIIERSYLRSDRKGTLAKTVRQRGTRNDVISHLAEKWTKQYREVMELLERLGDTSVVKR